MRCVITNDDGFAAEGLRALFRALRGLADVTVVAPAAEWSGAGHAAPTHEPIPVERREDDVFGEVFVVHSHPADCVRLALTELVHPRPEWVVAGINRGGNVGVDAYYSGTVAAAREAAILGCPAIAVSQLIRRELPEDWGVTASRARAVLEAMLTRPLRDGDAPLWNVNLPHLPPGEEPRGIRHVPPAVSPLQMSFERQSLGDGRAAFRYTGRYLERPKPSGTDVESLFAGWVTISELTPGLFAAR